MRRIAPLCIVALFGILSFTSCKKNYTCTCTIHFPADTASGMTATDTTFKIDLGKTKKSDAQSACTTDQATQNTVYGLFGGSATCSI